MGNFEICPLITHPNFDLTLKRILLQT